MAEIKAEQLDATWKFLQGLVDADVFPAISAAVGGLETPAKRFTAGRLKPDEKEPVPEEPIFLIASPTKPITATAVMMLVEAGELTLSDRVARFIPDFAAQHKEEITLAHCLTHTSGLPDQLPENVELRRSHATLDEFAKRVCGVVPTFAPGTAVQYQSMGTLMLGRVVEQVTKLPLPTFLSERVFKPLQMADTALGMTDEWEKPSAGKPARVERIAALRIPGKGSIGFNNWAADEEYGWNSRYWRKLGAPWGGLLSTAADLAKLCRHLLAIHSGADGIISQATLAAMTCNQLEHLPDVPESSRRCLPWGLGWQLNRFNEPNGFGDLLSPSVYGHWGASGTMAWIDPERNNYAVLLTSEPLSNDRRQHVQFSNTLCKVRER